MLTQLRLHGAALLTGILLLSTHACAAPAPEQSETERWPEKRQDPGGYAPGEAMAQAISAVFEEAHGTPLPDPPPPPPPEPVAPAPQPTTTVHVGVNSVHVGQYYDDELYALAFNTIKPLCPDVLEEGTQTRCSGDAAEIEGVHTVLPDNNLQMGTLSFTVNSSNYTSNTMRDALVLAYAAAFKASATGNNCQDVSYNACSFSYNDDKRRSIDPVADELDERETAQIAAGCDDDNTERQCSGTSFLDVSVYESPESRGGWLSVTMDFESEGLEFLCEWALEAVTAALTPLVGPEVGVLVDLAATTGALGVLIPSCE